jgi:hypothetical protein
MLDLDAFSSAWMAFVSDLGKEEKGGAPLCAIPGCGKPRKGRSEWCGMHIMRWKRHGEPRILKNKTSGKNNTIAERLFEQMKVLPGGHWIWTGAIRSKPGTNDNYGEMMVNGRLRSTHVVAYELFVGPVYEGTHIHHKCEVTRCFNPNHLEMLDARGHLYYHAIMQ